MKWAFIEKDGYRELECESAEDGIYLTMTNNDEGAQVFLPLDKAKELAEWLLKVTV